jgi:hypothetical protein
MKNKKNIAKIGILATIFFLLPTMKALASNQSQLNQSISDGTRSIDIVDAGGTTVASPSVSFNSASFSFDTQDTTAVLGVASQRVRIFNPTSTATWTASIAGSAPTASWTAGSNHYDFNDGSSYTDGADADSYGGQLLINPAGATLAGVSGCATTNVSLGGSSAFSEGSTDSITIASGASGAPTYCRWDITNIGLTQRIPASQASGSYSLNLVLSIV